MSNLVSNLIQTKTIGSPTNKAILMHMSDKASDDGSGIWVSKGNMAADLEMSSRAVRHHIKEMLDSGVFELGGHTITHPYLPNTSIEDKKYEMIECKNILETTFNTKVSSFAYPFGIYNTEDVEIIESSNFKSAVTTDEGVANANRPFELKRIKASGKDNFFAFKLRVRKGFRGFI